MSTGNISRDPAASLTIRPYVPADRGAVLALAPRLTIGIAPWRDAGAFLDAARGWIDGSIAGIGPDRAVFVADGCGRLIGFVSVAPAPLYGRGTGVYW